MSNNVTVTASFGSSAEGHFLFVATGTLVSDTNIAIVTPVVEGQLDASGNLSAVLLASDNFGSGELTWNCFATIRGFTDIVWRGFVVNYALGATQNLFTILEASGWTPQST